MVESEEVLRGRIDPMDKAESILGGGTILLVLLEISREKGCGW